jgi:outer membrane protein OmpA-like peptidoglycan-associated protein
VAVRSPFVSLLIASVTLSGCASKRYVSQEVGELGGRVDGLSTSVEKTQDRVRANEARIDQVNQQSQAGITDARGAAQQAMSRASDAEKASKGKLVYSVTLADDKVTFPVNKAEIGEDARKVIDETVAPLVAENRGVYLEIEGHTDSTGTKEFNKTLGEQRATMVRNYLHDQEGVALNRMEVISYGDAQPVVDNATPEHRAQNRRVVIKVLE